MTDADLAEAPLANDLYFVMHDDRSGRMRLHPRLTALGLAAAIVGELLLPRRITVVRVAGQGRIGLLDTTPTGDPLTQAALDHMVAEPAHPLQTWLQFLARTACADVAARMTAAGLLNPPTRWVRRHVPVDPNTAILPVARLNLAMQRGEPLGVRNVVLLGLLDVTGVAQFVLWSRDPRYLTDAVAALPAPLAELIAQTAAAVGSAVISRR
ncbi:GPP34 family phosphoprotein [Microbispora sp. RL4-1S]|uniref:GPP34 family phosphoprotein n=1 Tax=Microbispora oryzae TaxID=2806554 RepID=A0A941AHL9_9ACTN|nr:GPP34 family phosphoprotein [Microbispora oryzae]MBP2704231.1 GPP34 family phosphoprotein [Microbispora oryzae]